MRPIFPKFGRFGQDRIQNSANYGIQNQKIWEKIKKNLEKLCKKTRSNSKNIGEEFFSNIDHFVG
jgi:CRISPR/Cas system-associated endoribonuclease Cas2